MDPVFDYKRIPLLDRGMVYCIGHIRGGGEMGRSWYEDEVSSNEVMTCYVTLTLSLILLIYIYT